MDGYSRTSSIPSGNCLILLPHLPHHDSNCLLGTGGSTRFRTIHLHYTVPYKHSFFTFSNNPNGGRARMNSNEPHTDDTCYPPVNQVSQFLPADSVSPLDYPSTALSRPSPYDLGVSAAAGSANPTHSSSSSNSGNFLTRLLGAPAATTLTAVSTASTIVPTHAPFICKQTSHPSNPLLISPRGLHATLIAVPDRTQPQPANLQRTGALRIVRRGAVAVIVYRR